MYKNQLDSQRKFNSLPLEIIMFGTGLYADTLSYYINTYTNWEIVAYTADSQYITQKYYKGLPLLPFETIEEILIPDRYQMIMGVGYRCMNNIRADKFLLSKEKGYSLPNFIHPTALLNNVNIGEGNIVLENAIIEPNTIIGNNIIVWSGALIGHNAVVGDHNHFAAVSMIAGNVILEESCFLGNHSTVKDGLKISHHTLVGAGAYVSKDTKPYDVIVPMRSIVLEGKKSVDLI